MRLFYLLLSLTIFLFLIPFFVAFIFLYFAKIGLSFLDFSPSVILLTIFLIIIGSFFNIPFGEKTMVQVTENRFFGLIKRVVWRPQGVSINVGGALIPLLITGYFLSQIPLEPLIVVTLVVTFFSFLGSRFVQEKGVFISMILPVLFSAFFSVLLAPEHAVEVAFSGGVLGVLLGADILYLPWILRKNSGVMSIGGAGIFDGIFLVGLFSAIIVSI
jgi:uncharacterized membrane protein